MHASRTQCNEAVERTTVPPVHDGWQHSPEGRIVIGSLLALGLCYGLFQLYTAAVMALGRVALGANDAGWTAFLLFQGFQALALVSGGILAGAGQRRGAGLGAIVGVMSGLLAITATLAGLFTFGDSSFADNLLTRGGTLRNLALYGSPILDAFSGAVGGLVGAFVWRPLVEVEVAGAGPRRRARGRHWLSGLSWAGPVAWGRVMTGTAIAVAGAVGTNAILNSILLATQGKLSIVTAWEDQVSYGEIFSLSILVGGCVAGTNTLNGLRQGVHVGIAAAAVLGVLFLSGSLHGSVPAIYPVCSTLFLGPIGGWFGSELLPPLYVAPRGRKRSRFW